jgi:hypothetical protein
MTNVNLIEVARDLGLTAAKGNDSLTMLAMQATAWVAQGLASAEDAESVYLAYAEGVNNSMFGSRIDVNNKTTLKVQVSCFRTFMKPEVAKFGEVHQKTLVIWDKMGDATKSAYNSLVKINREQIKKATAILSDKEIKAALTPKDKADKSVAELIAALHKKVVELDDAHKPAGFQAVVTAFAAYVQGVASGSELIKADRQEDKSEDNVEPIKQDIVDMLSALGKVTVKPALVQ